MYVDQIFVRLQEEQVQITFGQAQLPYELGRPSPSSVRRFKREGVPVTIVARLAVTPAKLGTFIEQMTTIYNIWNGQDTRTASRPSRRRSGNA